MEDQYRIDHLNIGHINSSIQDIGKSSVSARNLSLVQEHKNVLLQILQQNIFDYFISFWLVQPEIHQLTDSDAHND